MAADRFAGFHDVRHFPEGTRTAEDAAAAIGCEVGQICKSLVFRVGDEALLVVTSGVNRVDTARFGARNIHYFGLLIAGRDAYLAHPRAATLGMALTESVGELAADPVRDLRSAPPALIR